VKRIACMLGMAGLLNLMLASPVLAQPSNDTYGGRTVIPSVPFSATLDTTEATTDPDDTAMNLACGAPATDASVWYEITPATDAALIVDVSASSYSAGVIVATGSPGSFSFVTCGPLLVGFQALASETYAILVFDDQQDGIGNGGTLSILVDFAPPQPEVDVTVDRFAEFDSVTGSATLTGTVTCTGTAEFTEIFVTLRQVVGRFAITGLGFTSFVCDGTTQPWSVEIFPDNGLFRGGRAAQFTSAVACGLISCGFDEEQGNVFLRG
jgi:hypothetical protein